MKPTSKLKVLLWFGTGVASFALLAFLSYRPATRETLEVACFREMVSLWAVSGSFALENKLRRDDWVEIAKVAEYLRGSIIPVCPSSKARFESFRFGEGPKCPTGHGSGMDILAAAFSEQDHPCRALALLTLGHRGMGGWNDSPSTAVIEAMIGVVEEDQGELRWRAVKSLERITRQKFGHDAAAWRAWWRENKQDFWQRPER